MDTKEKLQAIKDLVPLPDIMEGELLPFLKDNYWTDELENFSYTNVCLCPLHTEEEGSFRYFPNTNTCNCFAGCGGGDSVWLYREFNRKILNREVSFRDTVDYLYEKYVEGQNVSKITFTENSKEAELSTVEERLAFLMSLAGKEGKLGSLPVDEQLEYYYKVDTLKRLVSANKMSAVDASKELNTAFTKIRPR